MHVLERYYKNSISLQPRINTLALLDTVAVN